MALETAKANVVKHYAVVGVLEMWDETLEVMENTLPFFFSGKIRLQSAYNIYLLYDFQVPKKCTKNSYNTMGWTIKTCKSIKCQKK